MDLNYRSRPEHHIWAMHWQVFWWVLELNSVTAVQVDMACVEFLDSAKDLLWQLLRSFLAHWQYRLCVTIEH